MDIRPAGGALLLFLCLVNIGLLVILHHPENQAPVSLLRDPGTDSQGIPFPPGTAVGTRPPGKGLMVAINNRGETVYLTTYQQFQYFHECDRRWEYSLRPRTLTQEQADQLQGMPNSHRPPGWNYGRPTSP